MEAERVDGNGEKAADLHPLGIVIRIDVVSLAMLEAEG